MVRDASVFALVLKSGVLGADVGRGGDEGDEVGRELTSEGMGAE